MPANYPLIADTDTTRARTIGGVADPAVPSVSSLSRSDYSTLSAMFPSSPIYTTADADYRATAAGLLMPDVQTGDSTQFPSVDMNYAGSPDLSTPPVGFDSSYYPNLIANSDPAGGEGTATGTPLLPHDNFGSGNPVTEVTPLATAAIISQTTVDVSGPIAPAGQSGAGASSTHDINPGAVS